ncbi:cytochrome P450 [Phenylobacterium sp.]|uniref:cytochrome P450 n=1 Tax=Phenylobacterium sp. TaxID=1871053 RepID=UPI002F3E7BF3
MDGGSTLPVVHTQTAEFISDPNSVVGRGDDRPLLAQGDFGVEVLDYELVQACFRDRRLGNRNGRYFEKMGASPLVKEFITQGNFNMFDPEQHDRVRKVSVRAFMGRGFDHIREPVRAIGEALIARFIDRGRCNLVADFSHQFTIRAVSCFVGIAPEDVLTFDQATVELRLLGQAPLTPWLPRLDAALATLKAYGEKLIAEKRARPGEDYISDLIRASDEDGALTPLELTWSVANVLLAGHDTTRYQTTGLVRAVIEAGDWERVHQDNALIAPAVNEAMRLYPATPRQVKVALEPFEMGGHRFQSDDVIVPNMSAAGRDPRKFQDPDRFIIGRDPQQTVFFGFGNHHCLGHMLARTEMEVALKLLTDRLADVAVDGPIEMKPTGVIAGVETLPLTFRRRG